MKYEVRNLTKMHCAIFPSLLDSQSSLESLELWSMVVLLNVMEGTATTIVLMLCVCVCSWLHREVHA